jgi:hypothetical protein
MDMDGRVVAAHTYTHCNPINLVRYEMFPASSKIIGGFDPYLDVLCEHITNLAKDFLNLLLGNSPRDPLFSRRIEDLGSTHRWAYVRLIETEIFTTH